MIVQVSQWWLLQWLVSPIAYTQYCVHMALSNLNLLQAAAALFGTCIRQMFFVWIGGGAKSKLLLGVFTVWSKVLGPMRVEEEVWPLDERNISFLTCKSFCTVHYFLVSAEMVYGRSVVIIVISFPFFIVTSLKQSIEGHITCDLWNIFLCWYFKW